MVAAAFSGWQSAQSDTGGQICVTVTSDDRHTVRLWRWLTKAGKGDHLIDITNPEEQLARVGATLTTRHSHRTAEPWHSSRLHAAMSPQGWAWWRPLMCAAARV